MSWDVIGIVGVILIGICIVADVVYYFRNGWSELDVREYIPEEDLITGQAIEEVVPEEE